MFELDLAHAAVSAVLIFITVWAVRRRDAGDGKRRWDWRVFFAVFVVMAVLNIFWPYTH